MRLGGPVHRKCEDPGDWIEALRDLSYRAASCPVGADASDDEVQAYVEAAKAADIVVAEVGAWSNPISPDDAIRNEALETCKTRLALADRVGANCCVNIAGSRGEKWDGPHPDDLTDETFDLIVQTVREIIDAVKPTRTFYTLETMPWMYPDSPDSYARLIDAIDRERFAVHLDPVNLVCSPQRYFANGALIRECFEKLGPRIRSCHAKDIELEPKLTTRLNEVRPGLGRLDYAEYLRCLSRLDRDTTLIIEHLKSIEENREAARHIRQVAAENGLEFV